MKKDYRMTEARFDWERFAADFRIKRKRRKLTQAQMAKELELSKATISRLESTKTLPTLNVFLTLCFLLELSPLSYLVQTEDMNQLKARLHD